MQKKYSFLIRIEFVRNGLKQRGFDLFIGKGIQKSLFSSKKNLLKVLQIKK